MHDDYARLIRAIIRLYRAPQPGVPSHASMLAAAADLLERFDVGRLQPGRGARKAVARHLPAALAGAGDASLRDLADAFIAIEPASDWLQNPNYTAGGLGSAFLDNYGYVELVGPGRPVASDDFLIGLLLLGPDTLYPDHRHPAAEIYHVVSGAAQWWRVGWEWTVRESGAVIAHAPGVRHAMRTRAEPLLALYCWAGEIARAARLT